ncbi:membrane protein of unknown function [Cupriavidus taiwanensis]|nr:membrane protein of unknown function [Cupriavidus taiwanensis]
MDRRGRKPAGTPRVPGRDTRDCSRRLRRRLTARSRGPFAHQGRGTTSPRKKNSDKADGDTNMNRPNAVVRPDKPASILARLDRLPVMASHYVWAALLAANLMLEYYDNAIFAYASPTIKAHTSLSTEQIGFISSAFFIGMLVGALVGGRLSDQWGRRSVLVWTTVLYSLGALATAFARPTRPYWPPASSRVSACRPPHRCCSSISPRCFPARHVAASSPS